MMLGYTMNYIGLSCYPEAYALTIDAVRPTNAAYVLILIKELW